METKRLVKIWKIIFARFGMTRIWFLILKIQEINKKIQTIRMITEQHNLQFHQWKLDVIGSYLETQHPIVSVVGAKSAGKCALVNSLLDNDLLPSRIFKPRCLYSVSHGEEKPKIRLSTGETMAINSLSIDVRRIWGWEPEEPLGIVALIACYFIWSISQTTIVGRGIRLLSCWMLIYYCVIVQYDDLTDLCIRVMEKNVDAVNLMKGLFG